MTSQERAVAARDSGHFDPEIVSVTTPDGTEVTRDDGPRPGTTMGRLGELKPVFDPENGTVTAGNSCPLNDGAAAVLVMSDEKASGLGLEPKARIVASTVAAVRPEIMGLGPIPAVKAVLAHAGMSIGDIDVVELNEAFARVDALNDQLAALRAEMAPIRELAALRAEMAPIRELTAVREGVEPLAEDIRAVRHAVDGLEPLLEQVNTRLGAMAERIQLLRQDLGPLGELADKIPGIGA